MNDARNKKLIKEINVKEMVISVVNLSLVYFGNAQINITACF